MKNKQNKIKVLFVGILTMFLLGAIPASASTFLTSKEIISVKKGDVIKVIVSADSQNVKNYTFKSSIMFPSDLVGVSNWQWNDEWIPLIVAGYDSVDNVKGSIIKTAGYPGGVVGQKEFGVITFVAKKDGQGVISFNNGDGLILNADGEDTLNF
jgi:hypothetical protein